MSDVATAPHRTHHVAAHPVSLRGAVRSEWIKFITLRSTIAVLSAALIALPVVALIVAYNTRHLTADLDANDIVASSPLQGYYLGQLLIGALGVLFVTGEYSSGMIRATLTAVPKRLPVLWAKLIVFVTITIIPLVVMTTVSFLIAEAFISRYRPGFSLTDPGAARVAIGTGIYLTLVGVIGGMLGWIVRSTPGALVSYLGLILVLPAILGNVLGHWGKHVAEVLPGQAGAAFINIVPDGYSLRPWPGLLVMILWVIVLTAIAAIGLLRRDA
jgi:ABC-2 type transport system permease protein